MNNSSAALFKLRTKCCKSSPYAQITKNVCPATERISHRGHSVRAYEINGSFSQNQPNYANPLSWGTQSHSSYTYPAVGSFNDTFSDARVAISQTTDTTYGQRAVTTPDPTWSRQTALRCGSSRQERHFDRGCN
jgi:hypothetical protein